MLTSTPAPPDLARRATAELVGTALLVAVVVGSGIMAERLSPHDVGLQLLENSLATAGGLVAILLALGPVSGAHLNPVVSLAERIGGGLTTAALGTYVLAQAAGAVLGAAVANLMFGLDPLGPSTHTRHGGGLWLGESVATFGLVLVVLGVARSAQRSLAPFAVAAYIGAAYWFTSSTSFANPAVTLGRVFTDSFSGIRPSSAPGFVVAQVGGGLVAVLMAAYLFPLRKEEVRS